MTGSSELAPVRSLHLVARGTGLGDRLDSLLAPLAGSPRGTVFDAELVALSSRDGRAVQDFAAVCRAALQADAAAARKLHVVAFDLLDLAPAKMSGRGPG